MIYFAHELGAVIKHAESSESHISEGIVAWSIIFLGDESPLVPCPEIAVVESYPVVVEKIRVTSAPWLCECRLRYYGISFHERYARVEQWGEYVEHFSEKPVERLQSAGHAELHLCHMAWFMDWQHRRPRNRYGSIGGRYREEVHALRCPCHRTVGCVECVHYDGHEVCSMAFAAIACGTWYGYAESLKLERIDSCERVASLRIYDTVVACAYAVPSESAGVVACDIELGVYRHLRQKCYDWYYYMNMFSHE